jgi:hypothetical protein
MRVRWNQNTDTPLPPDEPAGENPPDGAMIDYHLDRSAKDVELEIRNDKGELVRKYRSDDKTAPVKDTNNVPAYWIRPTQTLSREGGTHRFLWDLHYAQVPNVAPDYPISAVYGNTAPVFTAPWVLPGTYSVTLKVDGKTYTQPLTVTMDPRVKTSKTLLQKQFELSKQLYDTRLKLEPINEELSALAAQLDDAKKHGVKEPLAAQIDALTKKLMELSGVDNRRPGTQLSLGVMNRVTTLFDRLQEVDSSPTPNIAAATTQVLDDSRSIIDRWKAIETKDIPGIKQQFKANGLPELNLTGRQVKYRSASDEDDDDDPRTIP